MFNEWIIDRDPTEEEIDQAGDIGFILCVSGRRGAILYDHAIIMGDNWFENNQWYIGGLGHTGLTIHGFMVPPIWEGVSK